LKRVADERRSDKHDDLSLYAVVAVFVGHRVGSTLIGRDLPRLGRMRRARPLISGRLEDATGHQNEVANDSYPGSVWLDTRDVRKPHYDR
jgi:hypothetical protein